MCVLLDMIKQNSTRMAEKHLQHAGNILPRPTLTSFVCCRSHLYTHCNFVTETQLV